MSCAYRRKRNLKRFIFIVVSVILILTLMLISLTKAFNSNEQYENTFSYLTGNLDKNFFHKNNNEISNEINKQKNAAINKVKTKQIIIIQKPQEPAKSNNSKRIFGSNVAFIGDSRTQAFLMYAGLKEVTDYTNIGLMVDTAQTKKFITNDKGEKITLLEDLKNRNIDTIYIMLGINELGWIYSSIFINKYEELIDRIKEIKPNCEIIIQSIIPVTKSKSDTDSVYNNTKIAEYNSLIKQMANRKNIKYIDLVPTLTDQYGYLPENASTDGIHLNKKYCLKWLECLQNN